jgi:pyridoxal phosphate enzyme (YggS family)
MSDCVTRLAANLASIRQRIAHAAAEVGRDPADVCLVAVTKYADDTAVEALLEMGITHLGESRPQQLWQRAEKYADCNITWHMIGHLQRNKARRTTPLVGMFHSIDSQRLLKTLSEETQNAGCVLRGLIQVNISEEEAKHGFAPQQVASILEELDQYPGVCIQGLMGMARLQGGAAVARDDFSALRELRDQLSVSFPNCSLDQLSMGMSRDFEDAIREGATLVRVGSILYEGT